ncbi:sulfatase [Arenibacter sp. H213]|uniref:Sulfatase n=1 Tax=Arenibacter antarcticus TaxID=2040469 RepID=A0ABW5VHI2_9FLAO|nr:sulfatase [Arenibacter sp. H213]
MARPNVLFVVFDDLNDWEGSMFGHPQSITPNIDRLAAKGILFSNAHSAGTMCCPSRTSVITGLRPSRTGVYKNTDTPLDLYKSERTLNKHFKENGYFVAGAGKILHKFHYEENDWDEFADNYKDKSIVGKAENPEKRNITKVSGSLAWGPFSSPDSLTFDGKTVDWVRERINRNHDKPFFLACGIYRPHIPWFVPEKYFELHPLEEVNLPLIKENDLDDVPLSAKNIAYSTTNFGDDNDLHNTSVNSEHETIKKRDQWPDAVRAYLAAVSYADAQFGRLLDELENSQYADNTIVVLWSDHGWHLGEKEHWRKATLWEEVTRVPLIIYDPKNAAKDECEQAVSLIDIYPTLIELCGLPQIDKLEGESLVPLLIDPKAKKTSPAISSLTPSFHSIRDNRFRYTSYGNGEEELYDHETDPQEWINVADDIHYSAIKERLKTFIPKNATQPTKGIYNKLNQK